MITPPTLGHKFLKSVHRLEIFITDQFQLVIHVL